MKSESVTEIIRFASNLSVIFPLVMYLAKIQNASKRIHIVGALVIVSGICDLVGYFLYKGHEPTAMLFNTYYAAMFFLLSWFYYEILFIKSRRVVVLMGYAAYLPSFLLVTLYVQPFSQYQTLMWTITGLIMITYSISYFIFSSSSLPSTKSLHYSPTWISSGVLVYFLLNQFLFIMSNHVLTKLDTEMGLVIWSFHNVNNILKNILFGIGISFHRRKNIDFTGNYPESLEEAASQPMSAIRD